MLEWLHSGTQGVRKGKIKGKGKRKRNRKGKREGKGGVGENPIMKK
jgi:hypothetical protein